MNTIGKFPQEKTEKTNFETDSAEIEKSDLHSEDKECLCSPRDTSTKGCDPVKLCKQTKKCDLNEIWNSIEIELLTDDKGVFFLKSWVGSASAARAITLSSPSFSERSRGAASKETWLVVLRHQFDRFSLRINNCSLPVRDATVEGPLSISSPLSALLDITRLGSKKVSNNLFRSAARTSRDSDTFASLFVRLKNQE